MPKHWKGVIVKPKVILRNERKRGRPGRAHACTDDWDTVRQAIQQEVELKKMVDSIIFVEDDKAEDPEEG